MPNTYQRELDFTRSVLSHLRIPVHIVPPGDSLAGYDGGLRSILGLTDHNTAAIHMGAHWSQERTIYKVLDQFMCRYIYLRLPGTESATALLLGPYLTADLSYSDLLEMTETLGLPLSIQPQLADYYASLPIYHDPAAIMAVVSALGERLWGGRGFDMVDVNDEQQINLPHSVSANVPIEQENILQRMQQMEERYTYENELMEIVSKGLTSRAESMMSNVSRLNYQPRVPDPLRNMKNYCIICNTILRKAAQQGGVHPFHLDEMSSRFARTIEASPTLEKCSELIPEMIRAYCRLVRTHAGKHYSAIVQKAQTYVAGNLSGDLSLTTLAGLMQVTPCYLSTLFHRETGVTLAEYITTQRMRAALKLLISTRLQVQSIAQLCGYPDPNYFIRQFRRLYGMTPLQYRRGQAGYYPPDQDWDRQGG